MPLPPACRWLSLWSLCVWKNLVVGGRKNEGSKSPRWKEIQHNHVICLGHAWISFPHCLLLPSFFLPPTTKFFQTHNDHNNNHLQAGGSGIAAIVGWEWRTWDASASRVPGMFLFFFFYSFTNFHYSYTTFTGSASSSNRSRRGKSTNKNTRSWRDSTNQRVNGDSTDGKPPQGFFFLFFFILYLIFALATTITLTATTTTGNDQTQTPQTRPLNVSMTATAAAVAARDAVLSCWYIQYLHIILRSSAATPEIVYCQSQPSPPSSFAARWIGKEAVFKLLGVKSEPLLKTSPKSWSLWAIPRFVGLAFVSSMMLIVHVDCCHCIFPSIVIYILLFALFVVRFSHQSFA